MSLLFYDWIRPVDQPRPLAGPGGRLVGAVVRPRWRAAIGGMLGMLVWFCVQVDRFPR